VVVVESTSVCGGLVLSEGTVFTMKGDELEVKSGGIACAYPTEQKTHIISMSMAARKSRSVLIGIFVFRTLVDFDSSMGSTVTCTTAEDIAKFPATHTTEHIKGIGFRRKSDISNLVERQVWLSIVLNDLLHKAFCSMHDRLRREQADSVHKRIECDELVNIVETVRDRICVKTRPFFDEVGVERLTLLNLAVG
jgi:hypothetical protein